jgi:hypothetical protein
MSTVWGIDMDLPERNQCTDTVIWLVGIAAVAFAV